MKKLTKLLSLLVLLTMSVSVWGDVYLSGSWTNWATTGDAGKEVGGQVWLNLDANTTYEFKVYDSSKDNKWYSLTNGYMRDGDCTNWRMYNGNDNCRFTTTVAGQYKFAIGWEDAGGYDGWVPTVTAMFPTVEPVATGELFGTYQQHDMPLFLSSNMTDPKKFDVDFYVATCGDKMILNSKANGEKTFDGNSWAVQIRANGQEIQATTVVDNRNHLTNGKTLNSKNENLTLHFFAFLNGEQHRKTTDFSYNRHSVNNPTEDATAPVLDVKNTTFADNGDGTITITFGEVTADDEYFYYVADKDHNLGDISLDNTITLTKPTVEDGTTYTFRAYAVDFNGNKSDAKEYSFTMPFDENVNLALNKPAEAGATQGDHSASKAVDESESSYWTPWGESDASKRWWQVDLGNAYNLTTLAITSWNNDATGTYSIQTSLNGESWNTVASGVTVKTTEPVDITSVGRYVKLVFTSSSVCIYNVVVNGAGVAVPDHVNPELTTFEKIMADVETITFHVIASDEDDKGNQTTLSYRVSVDNEYGEHSVTLDDEGNFTLEGLTPGINYTFTLTVTDPSGNTASKNVVSTTGLLAPTNVAVSAVGRVTFDAAEYATGYKARIYDGAELLSEQAISNNSVLQFITTKNAYTIKVISTVDAYSSLESEATAWTPEAGRVFGVSEYDHFTHKNLNNGGTQVALTWTTDVNGDVVIAISPVAPAKDAILRGYLARTDFGADWKVNGVEASTYFTRVVAADKRSTRLVLKDGAQLPYPCVITLTDQHTEWKGTKADDSELDGYTAAGILNYSYTYGTTCHVNPGVPGHVSVSATGRVQHDNVAGAVAYAARFKKDGAIVMQFDITSGEPINWVSTENATYQVTVLAFDAEGNMFDESETYSWTVEAGKVFGKSKYCNTLMGKANNWPDTKNSQNSLVRFTWETNLNGDVVITISEGDGGIGDQGADRFRGNGMGDGGNFTINELPISTYFTAVPANNGTEYILRLTDPANRPANGSHIKYKEQVTYRTSTSYDCWPTLEFDYIYGTKCTSADAVAPVIDAFEAVSSTYTTINFHVAASDVDDEGTPQTITYSLAGDNGFVTTSVTPDGEGNFVVEGLKKNVTYHFTLTVSDPAGNTASKNLEVAMPYDITFDWTEYATEETVWAGYSNAGDTPIEAVQEGGHWGSYGITGDDAQEKNWWAIDLGAINEISQITIDFEAEREYNIEYSFDDKAAADAGTATWLTAMANVAAGDADILNPNFAARMIRIHAQSASNMGIYRIHIKGSGWATTDAVAPQVTVTEVSKTENTATLKIVATDKDDAGVAHPVKSIAISGNNGFETIDNAELDGDGNIQLTGLKDNATYNFHVLVTDRVGLTASENITVRVAFNTTTNLALAKNGATAEAGAEEGANTADKAIDGKDNTYWGTYKDGGRDNWEEANTLTLTLAASYNINKIVINVGGTQGAGQILRLEYLDKDENWVVFENNLDAADGSIIELPVVVSAQKLRLMGTKNNMIAIKEFEVYGSGYDDPDTEKPQITAAALVGEVGEDNATIAVTATDNVGVYACRFTDGSFSEVVDLVAGQCHVTGLVPGTTYTFSIIALDRAGNESEPFMMESFRTVGNDAVPHTAAPTPKQNAIDVLSIYSDVYTCAVKDGFSWDAFKGDGTSNASHLTIGADNYTLYSVGGGNQVGIGTWTGGTAQLNGTVGHTYGDTKGLNIAGYKFLHVDVWTTESWNLTVTLNDQTLKANIQLYEGWNSIDLPISEFVTSHEDIAHNLRWMKFTNAAGHVIAVDNIYFWIDYKVEIDENSDNSSKLSVYDNRYVNVTLKRAFAAGTLHTLCLPFSMDEAQVEAAFGAGTEVWYLTGSEDRGSLIHIDFEQQGYIEAGVPYLFKPAANFVSGTSINGVVIVNTPGASVSTDLFTMMGYVNPTNFDVADGYYFLTADQYLHTLGNNLTSPGLRSAFSITEGADPAAARKPARVVLGTDITTDIPAINTEVGLEKIMRDGHLYIIRDGKMYNVQGQLVK